MHTPFRSKLPDVGTTIFTVISRRARELGALNLGQGFPDYPIDPRLTELLTAASPGQASSPEAAPDPAERYRDILARVLTGLLAPELPPA